ncbi:MAG TPA: hypothetical protein VJM33_08110 [Microthrixaceae bacterium]|nr:hypothetical protein [Microthrixaceae bacterium]
MARVVMVHGAFHELWGPYRLLFRWTPSMLDGLEASGTDLSTQTFQQIREQIAVAFWGDLFRPRPDPDHATDDDSAGPAAPADSPDQIVETMGIDITHLDAIGKAVSANTHQKTLEHLAQYFVDDELRTTVQQRVLHHLGPETEVVVAHSMGTIVAYEVLAANPHIEIPMLITLGSPLGVTPFIFDNLRPAPTAGRGHWPAGVAAWTNVAAQNDMATAAAPCLAPLFGGGIVDELVYNGRHPHDIEPYLTAAETGRAIARGLGDPTR